jgi:outer membrane protein insertion porin family
MPYLLVLVLLWAGSAAAQTKPQSAPKRPRAATVPAKKEGPAQAWPIASISVEGNHVYATDKIIAATGLRVGQNAGKAEFEAARDRLIATGVFDSVGYRFAPAAGGTQFAASFQVVEIGQSFLYRFEGLNDSKAIEQYVKQREPMFDSRMPATEQVLTRVSKEVEEYLSKAGHPESVVGKLTPENSNQLTIVFHPSKLPSVAEVNFTGNKALATITLQGAIGGVAVGSIYTEPRFQQLLDTSVRPLYEQIGKIRVSFPKLTTQPAEKVNGLVVTVAVNEGETYNLGKVNITGSFAGDQKLLREGKFKSGETADFTEIKTGVDRIEQALKGVGYMRVGTEIERKIDDKAKVVDIDLKLASGPQFSFGKLTIEGLDIESEPQIRKMWAMKTGQPYNAEYPYFFLRRIEEDGVFDNLGKTRTALHIDDPGRTVDVTLFFSTDGKPLPAVGPGTGRRRQP